MKTRKDVEELEMLKTLKIFKEASSNEKAHLDLLKEKKIILYAATLLECDNVNVLKLCLEILENFASNEQAHGFLINTFGIYEALETLSIRVRNKYPDIQSRAADITDKLRNSTPPAYNTRNRTKTTTKQLKRNQLYLLFIEELNEGNRFKLEQSLVKIKGVISFLIDSELKRCTIRICPKAKIIEIMEKIYMKCGLKAVIVTKNNRDGIESYCDLLSESVNRSYLEYPEEVHSPRTKTICTPASTRPNNGDTGMLKSLVNIWNESFYW
ncbi:hypothetical protein NQ315_000852 [Exocentrus adspersus]|uniref:Armadillo repeat-containing protein 1 n=1 Tax=Exocentrus adspersus TaxID=1586481 RepID=A0AAV8WG37_9CUCU|nr:hypothetical protein NQ315_000852 [Exocentrus adspersus]